METRCFVHSYHTIIVSPSMLYKLQSFCRYYHHSNIIFLACECIERTPTIACTLQGKNKLESNFQLTLLKITWPHFGNVYHSNFAYKLKIPKVTEWSQNDHQKCQIKWHRVL